MSCLPAHVRLGAAFGGEREEEKEEGEGELDPAYTVRRWISRGWKVCLMANHLDEFTHMHKHAFDNTHAPHRRACGTAMACWPLRPTVT